jgi:hypothetical protein
VHFEAGPAGGRRSPVARAAWGAAAVPPRAAPDYGVVQMAFVHHTVTANDYTPDQSASMVLAIAKYHRDTNGWNDIGYNFLVDQYGQVFEGRAGGIDQAVIGAQAQGYNSQSTGVAVLGTFTAVPIPEAAVASITQLLGWKLTLHGVPCEGGLTIISGGGSLNRYSSGTPVAMQRISGHRDGDSTECPGDALYAQLPELRRRAAALAGPIVAHGEISLQTSADAIAYGADAVFTGTVIRPDSTAGAGELVALQKRGSAGAWVTVARTTALIDGSWVVRVPWRRGGDVRAVAAGVTSKALPVHVTPALTTHGTPRRVRAGSSLGLSGRVRPSVAVAVLLERQGADGRFHRVRIVSGTRRLTNWRAAVSLRRPGLYRLTARTAAKDGNARGRAVYVRVVRARRG